jgi:hypothetical protein
VAHHSPQYCAIRVKTLQLIMSVRRKLNKQWSATILTDTQRNYSNETFSSFVHCLNFQKFANVVIVGSAAVDITAQECPNKSPTLAVHSTAPGKVSLTLGGVGRNIAEATHRVMQAYSAGQSSLLIAPVGADSFGHLLMDEMRSFGMRTDGLIKSKDKSTAVCNMVLDSQGALVGGVAAMEITEQTPTEDVSLSASLIW